jgi:hypothetical protein
MTAIHTGVKKLFINVLVAGVGGTSAMVLGRGQMTTWRRKEQGNGDACTSNQT